MRARNFLKQRVSILWKGATIQGTRSTFGVSDSVGNAALASAAGN
jgi:hypothetical protein